VDLVGEGGDKAREALHSLVAVLPYGGSISEDITETMKASPEPKACAFLRV